MASVGGEIDLLSAASNGNGTTFRVPRFAKVDESHLRTLYVWGTFDSATVTFQISTDDVTWFDVANADAITAQSALNVEFRAPYVRGKVAGGLGSESINMRII